MSRITRRKFLGSTAAVPLGLGIAAETSAQGRPATGMATMIVTGANVYTMVWDNPKATAIAVRGNRLLAVGDDDDIIRLANASTRRIDARGMLHWLHANATCLDTNSIRADCGPNYHCGFPGARVLVMWTTTW